MSINNDRPSGIRPALDKTVRIMPFLLAALLWAILILRDDEYLRKVEDLSLFLFDRLFILESLKTPAGALGLAGSFFTQFLHIPEIGALIWVVLLLVAAALTRKAFNIPDRLSVLSYLPAVILVISNVSLGYGIFIMRAQDHFFSPVLGFYLMLVPFFLTARTDNPLAITARLIIWTALIYPLAGFYALAGTLCAGFCKAAAPGISASRRITVLLVSAATVLLIPILSYNLYTSIRLADAWTVGLPAISDNEWTGFIRLPFVILLILTLLIPILVRILGKNGSSGNGNPIWKAATLAIYAVAIWLSWFQDFNFRTELAMSRAVDNADWNQVTELFTNAVKSHLSSDSKAYASRSAKIAKASQKEIQVIVDSYEQRFFEPTRTMVMYRDLALLKTNKALNLSFTMKDGGRKQKSRTQIPMAYQSGKQFYLHYGLENMCYRWCMEDIIEHGWSFSTLRYMVEYSIVTGERNLAIKHLDKLSKTLFYRKWASSQRELLDSREAVAATEPYKGILPYLCHDDRMSNDMGRTELYVMSHFTGAQPENATATYNRAALLFAMRSQNIPLFWQRLQYYTDSNNINALPRPVQEAALLYSTLESRGVNMIYDISVKEALDSFNKYVSSHPIRNMKESQYPFSQKYGNTFFYFYYFIRNLKTY